MMTKARCFKYLMVAGMSAALVACGQNANTGKAAPAPPKSAPATKAAPAPDFAALAAAAVADPARPDKDRADDAARKPAAVLAFAGIAPGMTVLEMEAGSGYYTQMLSTLAGPSGHVIMQNPAAFDAFLGERVAARLAGGRLGNVRLSKTSFDALDAPDASVDVVTWFLGPHELFYTPKDGASLGDPKASFAQIFRVLKPGGALVVLDHAAAAGAPSSTGGKTHRIDPAIVKALARNAGLELVASSAVLANPDDDHNLLVFDPRVRRKTDRFLLKFKKPESA